MSHNAAASLGTIVRVDPAIDALVPPSARIERIATGFLFTEGPLYLREGCLLFSDIPGNVIRRWTPEGGAVDYRRPSGYDGSDMPEGAFIGSNGMTLDREGRLIICEHGRHRVTRVEQDGSETTLAESYEGQRLNSPNDVLCRSDGMLYFTDPPYGLPAQDDDTRKELPFNGIYRLDAAGRLTLLDRSLRRPNGLAFTADEKVLYVANSDDDRRIWMRYEVTPEGDLTNGRVFFDVTGEPESGNPDGMKIDVQGNLYCTGPGGIWIFSPDAKHLGTIKLPEWPANLHWGKWATTNADAVMAPDEPATTLYITATTSVYRVQLGIAGIRP